jgi:hypothetical protein
MEVRAIYENREASKCRRLILDSPGLSKTVVSVTDGTVDSLPQGSELASGYPNVEELKRYY